MYEILLHVCNVLNVAVRFTYAFISSMCVYEEDEQYEGMCIVTCMCFVNIRVHWLVCMCMYAADPSGQHTYSNLTFAPVSMCPDFDVPDQTLHWSDLLSIFSSYFTQI